MVIVGELPTKGHSLVLLYTLTLWWTNKTRNLLSIFARYSLWFNLTLVETILCSVKHQATKRHGEWKYSSKYS